MTKKETLYLIDGSSYIFRAFYGVRQFLSNSKGMPTNALYGFVTMLQKVVREEQPDYLAVVFDTKEKTFRHDMYPDYKGNRDEAPDDLKPQFPYFTPVVEAFNIVSLKQDGFEADDIIGTLAKQGDAAGLEVVIVSGDKDMMQLVTPNVHMLDTMKAKRFEAKDVIEKFTVPPDKVIEVMGLMGDSSDNIPGVAGVGPKTAGDLINKFGSIKNLYDEIDKIDKVKLREKLERDKENAFLSRELVTIDVNMKLSCEIKDLKTAEPDTAKLKKVFGELEFDSLLAGLVGEEKPVEVKTDYETIFEEKALDKLIKDLKKAKTFALDLETTSKYPVHADIVGISFSHKDNYACYIPVAHRYLGVPTQLDKKLVLEKLKPILEDPKYKKFGQNIKYDLIVFRNEGVDLQGIDFDTMLASYVIDPSKRAHSLDDLAKEFLGRKTISYKEVAGTGQKEIGFDEVEIEKAADYAAEDSDITWLLRSKLEPLLKDDTLSLYNELEIPLIDTLADMEMTGILLDKKYLAKLSTSVGNDLQTLEEKIYEIADGKFNINSPKQLGVILFEQLELPVVKKTKTGYSTDVKVLEELAPQHPLPEKILEYRQLSKIKSTYIDSLPEDVFRKTGRVHTSYNQTIAATGRLSSSDPNLQNIPIRSDLGKEIRKAFIADKGCKLLSADYSQVELRILAHLANDKALISAFKKGEDVHARTAAEIFGVSIKKVDEDQRRSAKAINFGIVYGLSPFGLSRQLKISMSDAKQYIEQYFKLYSNVKKCMDDTIEGARKNGYTSTLLKRRRYLPDINSKNRQVREAAERIAINSPVQGSAADMIKVAMINLHNDFAKKKLKSKMLLQVHDELVFESPEDEQATVEKIVKKEMEGVFKLKVPLVVDMAWGQNWNEAH
jgi:DNA polymerase-1